MLGLASGQIPSRARVVGDQGCQSRSLVKSLILGANNGPRRVRIVRAFSVRQSPVRAPINSSGTAGGLWCHGAETPVLVWQARLVCNECGAMDIDGVATGTERR
jgi:hypothetical protein